MPDVFMTDPTTGRCALYSEPSSSGAFDNPNSARNAPLNNPNANLPNVKFHSDFDYLEVALASSTTISHAFVAAGAPSPGRNKYFSYVESSANHLLATHNLGYVPFAIVSQGSNIIWPGMPVQVSSNGTGIRYATVYATTTQLRLYEWTSVSDQAIPAASITYNFLIFNTPPSPSGDILIDFNPSTGVTQMGKGKFNSSKKYLQVRPGGSPLGFALSRTIDLSNGAPRAYSPGGTSYHPVPSDLRFGTAQYDPGRGTTTYPLSSGTLGYNGSFTAPTTVQVQAP